MRGSEERLKTGTMWKLVLSLAVPSMLAQLVNVLYSVVDRIYIGQIADAGQTALAAVGVCGPIVTLLSSFAFLIGLGGAPLVTIRLGEGNKAEAKRILANCFLMLLGISVLLTVAVFLLKDSLLLWFGASSALLPFASEYLTYYAAGTLFAVLAAGLNSFIVCQGMAKSAMWTVLIGAGLNIALDPLFIFAFGLGVRGAAIATVLSQLASAVYSVLLLAGKRVSVRVSFGGYSLKIIRRVLLLGLSPFLIIATDSVMILALNGVLQAYGGAGEGDKLVTAATIVLSVMQMITMPLGGITGGTQPVLSYHYGARNSRRVLSGMRWILLLCLIFTSAMTLLTQLGADVLAGIFTRDPEMIALSAWGIRVYAMMIIPLAFQYAFVDGLTALGIAPVAITLSMFRKIAVMLTLTFTLPAVWGASGAFYAEPIADLVSGVVTSVVFLLLIRRILRRREGTPVYWEEEKE